ncbi:hypothetical protein [Pseudoflavonifractor sp. 60]|uniref:hypothetical protein n=1 Tax=Pseudoflavonifractor sp. 60 TaxID=2304576 RepID=UPI00136F1037|nr:hypothetical protein [Pseudoflavonifractor sp. 60]
MELTSAQETIKEILLTPIVCDKHIRGISFRNGVVYSGQRYYSAPDPDMSDFAVGFYKAIYNKKFPPFAQNGCFLDGKNNFFDINFAGDTMNSFATISNLYAPTLQWCETIWNYFHQYPCLANFWVIPKIYGRGDKNHKGIISKKCNRYDAIDIFLEKVRNIWNGRMDLPSVDETVDYWGLFKDFDDFCEVHCLDYEIIPDIQLNCEKTKYLYRKRAAVELTEQAMKSIEQRAKSIAHKHYNDLWTYFKELGLIS